jgi:predicted Zn-dependent peptidase
MANYILNEYLNGKIISLETKMKDIEKMTAKDFMKLMSFINNGVVAYQGPEKINLIPI